MTPLRYALRAARSSLSVSLRSALGYSMTSHLKPKLKAAAQSVARLKDKVRHLWRQSRGRNLGSFIREDLNPVLRGWASYYRLSGVKVIFEELDAWVRRKLRCSQWRHWKCGRTRMKELLKHGLDPARARAGAFNGRGPWWNAKASHMNAAMPGKWFRQRELVFMLEVIQRYQEQAAS